jgi:hypothetical protein
VVRQANRSALSATAASVLVHFGIGLLDSHSMELRPVGHLVGLAMAVWLVSLVICVAALVAARGRAIGAVIGSALSLGGILLIRSYMTF